MNVIRRPHRDQAEIAKIRSLVDRQVMPDFLTSVSVELGDFHEEPSAWITFHLAPSLPADSASRSERVDVLRRFREAIHSDFLADIPSRYPYYRYAEGETAVQS